MLILLNVVMLVLLLVAQCFLVALLVTVLRIGRHRWDEARNLSGSFKSVLLGEVKTNRDGQRDIRVSKGMVWDKARQRRRCQGKLSDEYIRSLVS